MSDDGRVPGFRRAAPAGAARNLAKTALQTALFWGLFLFVIPEGIVRVEAALGVPAFTLPAQHVWPWVLFGLASGLGLASGATMALRGRGTPLPFDTARRLVVAGPYRHVRNPMAVAGLAQGAAIGLWRGSWSVLIYVLAGGLLWNAIARPTEERFLERTFGDEYRAYRNAVRCWVPRRRPYRP